MWYLAIIVVISILFSAVLYHDASLELARGLHRESSRIYQQFPVFQNNPILQPNADITSGEHRLLLRLAVFNVIVFIAAGWASYWLARRTLEPIEAAHEQQKRFTADVSHELRTPLTAIRMESEVALLGDVPAKELQSILKSNLEEVSKLEQLINNLLRLTRLEASELQHQFQPVQLHDILLAAEETLVKASEQHDVTIKNSHPMNATVSGDSESLQQLFVILLDNAIKYSLPKSIVTVDTIVKGDKVSVSIQDHGIGISKNNLEQVFDRFYRADNSRTRGDTEGYGLGLSIAKMIADVHEASIDLASAEGQGTIATVTLATASATPATD
jgi:two-component system sensor histidine kinase CiaH